MLDADKEQEFSRSGCSVRHLFSADEMQRQESSQIFIRPHA